MTLLRKSYSPGIEGGGIPDEARIEKAYQLLVKKSKEAYLSSGSFSASPFGLDGIPHVRRDAISKLMVEFSDSELSFASEELARLNKQAVDTLRLYEVMNEQITRLKEENERLREGGWISVEDRLPDIEKDGEKVLLYRVVNDSQKGLQITVYDTFLVKHCDKTSYWRQMPTSPTKK